MRLSISNIGWENEKDDLVYAYMKEAGFAGLEIAPTRIFPNNPYDEIKEARNWSLDIKVKEGFDISSMQSIWYGRSENLFATTEGRKALFEYTKKAIDFAEAINCGNLVFGCPRNRNVPDGYDVRSAHDIAVCFFKDLGEYAFSKGTVLSMEANPPIYNTNFINRTEEAIELVKQVDSRGFLLNYDLGTAIENNESLSVIADNIKHINHVHISEPGLKVIEKRQLHKELFDILKTQKYEGYVSVEMGKQEDISNISRVIKYVSALNN